ncbi:protein SCO1 homolog 1, mitochondrial [Punica granatum]|uniref:Protein SCO1 homolog 1, mitochondrial n=1 Tax=Punica granatum TaxID=22663 RepID=A0A6P8DSZ2_PUNGR|nr:protein SCO1 homolog 1, mitochondrial [Punica granatum]
MASLISRNARSLRLLHRCLRPPARSVSPLAPLPERSLSPLHSLTPLGLGVQTLEFHQRCLYLSTSTAAGNSAANAEAKTDAEAESAGQGKSEGSNQGAAAKLEAKTDAEAKSAGEGKSEGSDQGTYGKPVRGGPVSWLSFLFLVATGAGLVYYYDKEKKQRIEEISNKSQAVKEGPSAGKAAIGGPFSLVNDEGKRVTERSLLGKWTLIYFGFTHCPDICPDELQKLAAAVDKIKEKAGIEIVPVFISVDPERDTVEQVHEYVKEFHPKLIGLTGTPDEIKKVARAYRVYYMKTAEEDSDYLVDHSIVMYLMDPNMGFVKFFGKNNDVDTLTDGIINEIKRNKSFTSAGA